MQLLNSKILSNGKNTRYSNKKHKIRNILCFLAVVAFSYNKDVQVTGLELTTLTNLLFIIIPQGYLPCAKLFMVLDESFILISSDCVSFF